VDTGYATVTGENPMPERYDHASLKRLSETMNRPLKTLFALSQSNDPFIAGIPFRRERADWFADMWQRFGKPGAHIRRVHYVMISQDTPILMSNGEEYINTEDCYDLLGDASLDARYLLLVPARDLVDRRNDDPTIYLSDGQETAAYIAALGGAVNIVPPSLVIPYLNITPPRIPQRYHIEIWCEKSTMNDVLIPLCRRYGINLVTGVGQLSLTHCFALVDRAAASGRPVRILYVSDFDHQGDSMPVAVARKVEWVLRTEEHDFDIQVRPIALTFEQCQNFQLRRTPAKSRDAAFAARYGEGFTELDALEAQRPGELERILTQEILRYYDNTLDGQIADVERQAQTEVGAINAEIRRRHARAINKLERERDEVTKIIAAFEKKAGRALRRITRKLRADAPNAEAYDWPEPVPGAEDPDPLFDSKRGYVEQIDRYKRHQDKPIERNRKMLIKKCRQCGNEFTAWRNDAVFCDGVGRFGRAVIEARAEARQETRRGRGRNGAMAAAGGSASAAEQISPLFVHTKNLLAQL
jgi:hypothetical protein